MAIYLIVKENEQETRVRLTAKPFFIGRSSKCHLTLDDTVISGKHLAVKINDQGRAVIKDLETTNGTFLNGSKIQESFIYLDDFVQIGSIKIYLDDSEMSSKELGLHKRDFEKTSVTFVRLGSNASGVDDDDVDEFGESKQKTLLAKIRKKQELDEETKTSTLKDSAPPPPKDEVKIGELGDLELKSDKKKEAKVVKKKKKRVTQSKEEDDKGLVGKLKGLFKKD